MTSTYKKNSQQSQSQACISFYNVSISYGNCEAVKNIFLDIPKSKVTALIGPSGCGKSTALRLLAGLLLPTSGNLRLFGSDQKYLRLDQLNPPDVRFVFQNPALLSSLTINENVGFLLRRDKQLSKKKREILEKIIKDEADLLGGTNKIVLGGFS